MLRAASRYCSSMVRMPAAVDSMTGKKPYTPAKTILDSEPMPNQAVNTG